MKEIFGHTGWRVVLQESKQFNREPRCRHKVVSVVLQVCVGGCHYL
jgi:hypothetical protein